MSVNENNNAIMKPAAAVEAASAAAAVAPAAAAAAAAPDPNPLMYNAVVKKNYAAATEFVKSPTFNPLWRNEEGNTYFHVAFETGDIHMFGILTSSGKPYTLTVKNAYGYTPLELAISRKQNAFVNTILSIPQFTDAVLGLPGKALHMAAIHNNAAILPLLLTRNPASLNSQTNLGETPLLLAVRYNNIDVVNALLANPATDTTLSNHRDYTPLQVACYRENYDMIRLLIESGRIDVAQLREIVHRDNIVDNKTYNNDVGEEEKLINFSNMVNNILVSYARQFGIDAKRPPIKTRFQLSRLPISRNINVSQPGRSGKNYKERSHPSCLSDIDLFSLYSRLRIPQNYAILQQESLTIFLSEDATLNISPHPAFIERLSSPTIPFVGQLYINFSAIGHGGHVCSYLYINKTLYILDTANAYYLMAQAKTIFDFIEEEVGFDAITNIVDVAGKLEELYPGYHVDLQQQEGTGYCTMWSALFIEEFGALIPMLIEQNENERLLLFKHKYDTYKADPTYAYKFYQTLSARQGGGKRRRTYRAKKRRVNTRKSEKLN